MKQIISLYFILFSSIIFAQDKIDTITINNNGKLTIEIDQRINNIITTKENDSCPITKKNTVKKETIKSNNSDPCATQNQINGYKIQIYYSKNRTEADKVKNEFERNFPNISTQVVYFTPDYRVLVGDYLSKNSASSDIKKLKSKYNNAFAIPHKVLCRKAK